MEFKFTEENLQRIQAEFKKYPVKQPVVMKAIYIAQEQNGFITGEVIQAIAALLEMPEVDVYGVVSFYTMFRQEAAGKYHLQVCTNVSCMLRGGLDIYAMIQKELGIQNHQVTADKKFSLEEVECMGACGGAPMIAVNEDFYENITVEKTKELIKSLS